MRRFGFRFVALVTLITMNLSAYRHVQSQQSGCTAQANFDQMPIFAIPLESYKDELLYAPKGASYPVLSIRDWRGGMDDGGEMYLIQIDNASTGWVAFSTASLQGDCNSIPRDTTPRADYKGICSAKDMQNGQYLITGRNVKGFDVYCGHARACSIPLAEAQVVQPCEPLPFAAGLMKTKAAAQIFADPNPQSTVIATIGGDTSVYAIETTSPYDPAHLWYRIVTKNNTVGWIPQNILSSEDELVNSEPWPVKTATLSAGSNLWTAPDVKLGRVFTSVNEDTSVEVLIGPISGQIRDDSDMNGGWYYVHIPNTFIRWWVWEQRLNFQP